jgi:dipeptide transport system permease protein
MGLDRPLYEQFITYVGQVLRGDLGVSVITHRPVLSEFFALFPATLELAFFATLLAVIVGLPAGVFAAVKRGSAFDHVVMGASLTGYSMPIFWWGQMLILAFSVYLHWTPVSGRIGLEYFFDPHTRLMTVDAMLSGEPGALRSALSHLILPSIVLGTIPLAVIARMTRSSMLEVLGEDYIRTARAKGLSETRILTRHALRTSLITIVTLFGLDFGALVGGAALLTEVVFGLHGLGKLTYEALRNLDLPVIMATVMYASFFVVAANAVVDLLYAVLDPRIRTA